MTSVHGEMSARLQRMTEELKNLEHDLKSEQHPDMRLVQDFRDALDSSRMTAWTITELLRVRQINLNPQAALPFLFAERIRRFTQMTKDLSDDMNKQNPQFHPDGIDALSDVLEMLQSQLNRLASR